MHTQLKIDPAFSIIYHDTNRVEFRSGVWSVKSHCFNDESQRNTLAKIILEIEKNGFNNISDISKKTNTTINECEKVFDSLQQSKLLVDTIVTQTNLDNSQKIILLDDNDSSNILFTLCKAKFPTTNIMNISRQDLFFIEQQNESIFTDNLVLEKIIEQCKAFFENSLVIIMTKLIDLSFYLFLNKVLYESGVPWFFTAIDGPFLYVGPLFNRHFCFECLEHRILMNTKQSVDYVQYKKAAISNKIKYAIPEVDDDVIYLASALASMEISHYLTTGRCIAEQKMLSVFRPTMEFSYHKILRLPGCKVCGVDNALHGHQLHFDMGVLLP